MRTVFELALQWNEENNIKFLRISSEMFPFASHDKYGYSLDYAEKELKVRGTTSVVYLHDFLPIT